jgi:Helix-turn-helix domain
VNTTDMPRRPGLRQQYVRVLPGNRLLSGDAAAYCGYSDGTFAQWRYQGKGPPFHRVGRRIFYRLEDLNRFIGDEAGD